MLYHPDFIVYLWLLPVTFMVLIPAALLTCRFSIGCVKSAPATVKDTYPILDQDVIAEA